MSLTVVVNIVPAAIVKDDWDVGTLETVIFTVALEDFIELGVYPNALAWETALALVTAESINISFASIFAWNAK